jgi:hypothetical protein
MPGAPVAGAELGVTVVLIVADGVGAAPGGASPGGCGPGGSHRGAVRVVNRGRRLLGGAPRSPVGLAVRVGVRLRIGPRLRSSLRRGRRWCLVDRGGSAPRGRGCGRRCRARERCGFVIATAARADEPTEDQDKDDQAPASRDGVALLRWAHAALPRARVLRNVVAGWRTSTCEQPSGC